MLIDKYFEEQIKESLKKLSKKQQVKFAWLCAVRALPFLSETRNFKYWEKDKIQMHLFSILRAIDISAYADTYDADYDAAYDAATAAATAATADDPYSFSSDNPDIIAGSSYYASYTATYTAATAATAAATAATAATAADAAVYAYAAYAAYAISRGTKIQKYLLSLFLSDIDKIYENKLNEFDNNLNIYGEIWQNFKDGLNSIGCEYWAKLYADLFLNKFQIDTESLERRLNVPKEIQEKGACEVGKWLENLELQGAEHLNETRLIILGEMGAGKTSLVLKFQNANADLSKNQESTVGVDLSLWKLPKNSYGNAVNAHVWDFAGQAVTHSVHKFFLSERCIYIIVYDGRTEARNRLEYWLNLVETYGGDSPVFILVNKHTDYFPDINENGLKDKYTQIQDFVYLSLVKDISKIKKFTKTIEIFIKENPAGNQKIPKLWFAVKEELSNMFSTNEIDCITTGEFKTIAKKFNIVEDKGFEDMRNALSTLGICLYYEKIKELETLVLNPNWITHGIYTIIAWLRIKQDYKVKLSDLNIIFKKELGKYPKDKHKFLFRLLELYDLAYPYQTEEDGEVFILPALLTEQQPEQNMENEFPVLDSLGMIYQAYADLPPDTISRFIVNHHKEIMKKDGEQIVWRKGVKLQDNRNGQDKRGNIALVKEIDREIKIYVKGLTAKTFLSKLRNTLNEIFKTYQSKFPKLGYRVIDESGREIVYADEKTIITSITNNIESIIIEGVEIKNMENVAEKYDIKIGDNNTNTNLTLKSIGVNANQQNTQNRTEFNFHESFTELRKNLNSFQSELFDHNYEDAADEISEMNKILKEAKDCKTPQEVEKRGIKDKICEALKKLGAWLDLSNENSGASKVIKAGGNITEIAGKLMAILKPVMDHFQ